MVGGKDGGLVCFKMALATQKYYDLLSKGPKTGVELIEMQCD